jgi:hypothetical protein
MDNCPFKSGQQVVVLGLRVNDIRRDALVGMFIRQLHVGSNKGKYLVRVITLDIAFDPSRVVAYDEYYKE